MALQPVPDLSLLILLFVLGLTAVRKVGRMRLAIWQIMVLGAGAALLTGGTSPTQAWAAIEWDVMGFLFGVFVLGEALVVSGYLFQLSHRLFGALRSPDGLLLALILAAGLGSAFLMNDTLAIIGTPLVLLLAREHALPPKLLLLALAFAITTGSATSPIGNPQNLLIALGALSADPFALFFRHLFVPTLINLLLTYGALRLAFRRHFPSWRLAGSLPPATADPRLAVLARTSLLLLLAAIVFKVVASNLAPWIEVRLTFIALLAALPILLGSARRVELLWRIDWRTLAFFAALFILMDAVWRSEHLHTLLDLSAGGLASLPAVLALSALLSQLVSNVPLVGLYLPVLLAQEVTEPILLALAAGSTIAGNLLIWGAASNVIVIQAAERQCGETLGFLEFARIGVPLAAVQLLVFGLFLAAPM